MRGARALPPRRRNEAGLGLVTAIVLLVVLSGMAVALVTLSTAQQATSSLDLLGARAYQAARAGIEVGLFRGRRNDVCAGEAAPFSFDMPAPSSLAGFSVTVVCVPSGGAPLVRRLTATACNRPDGNGRCPNQSNHPDYVQRVLHAQF